MGVLLLLGLIVSLTGCDEMTGAMTDENTTAIEPTVSDTLTGAQSLSKQSTGEHSLAAAPQISRIGGYTDGVPIIKDGRWTGQPSHAPSSASNKYLGYLALDTYSYSPASSNPYYWTIKGSGFGSAAGSIKITALSPYNPGSFQATVISWKDTEIKIRASGPFAFLTTRLTITMRTSGGRTVSRTENVVEIIKSRGYGQCTYHVAYKRILNGKSIPNTAYATNGTINGSYVPRRWDGLVYSGHVAIIESTPVKRTNADGSTTWTFTVGERNARWDEAYSTYAATFTVRNGVVIVGIGTKASTSKKATGYWR